MNIEVRTKSVHFKFSWGALTSLVLFGLCAYFDVPLPW